MKLAAPGGSAGGLIRCGISLPAAMKAALSVRVSGEESGGIRPRKAASIAQWIGCSGPTQNIICRSCDDVLEKPLDIRAKKPLPDFHERVAPWESSKKVRWLRSFMIGAPLMITLPDAAESPR